MKGEGGGKEVPVEGEVSCKQRPKRKCLQWHPLLSKNKGLDFSEEEEDEDEEEMEKVSSVCTENSNQVSECVMLEEEGEEDSSEQRARRPMNAFLLFCKRHRSLVRQEHPRLDNRGATKILADWWAVLEASEKQKYTDMAKEYKDAFMRANPGYKWCPTTSKPVKSPTHLMSNMRKKSWPLPSNNTKDIAAAKKISTADNAPQLNFAIADPTKMGGLSMLLLAGEHALSAREISSSTSHSAVPDLAKHSGKSELFQLAEISTCSPQSVEGQKNPECRRPAAPQTEVCGPSQPNSPDLPSSCMRSPLFQLAEISSCGSQASVSEGKQCGQSALFQLAEMCLASEAEKLEALSSQPAMDSSSLCAQHITANTTPTMDLATPTPSSSSTYSFSPTSCPSLKKRKKRKLKEFDEAVKAEKNPGSPKKSCKKRLSSDSDLQSLMYTIEAVAKGAWGLEETEAARKKAHHSDDHEDQPSTPEKKKTKPKAKKQLRIKVEDDKKVEAGKSKPCEPDAENFSHEVQVIPECRKEKVIKSELFKEEEDAVEHCFIPQPGNAEETDLPQSPTVREERDLETKPALTPTEEKDNEPKPETCGSRKSERSCKGALYKTLVSEGMLTSLRANVDRGKRGSMRGSVSELEIGWTEESCNFSQPASSNPKKLKKTKSKEEQVSGGLGKLEEEFEKKFNSLPQYSPLTFDKKCVTDTKRKKANVASLPENPLPCKGPSSSQKKNLFHKIVNKYKHKKEKISSLEKAIDPPEPMEIETSPVKAETACVSLCSDTRKMGDIPVGSQKRKARKSKITHLVRLADGRVSPVEADKMKEPNQKQDEKPLNHKTLCNKERCYTDSRLEESDSLPAFFSLTALAEVAAMENMHRGQRAVNMAAEGQVKDMTPQTPVLISCADQ